VKCPICEERVAKKIVPPLNYKTCLICSSTFVVAQSLKAGASALSDSLPSSSQLGLDPSCNTSAESSSVAAPEGVAQFEGRRCRHEGCTKSARGGAQPYCKSHGGGRRCEHDGCTKAAEGMHHCIAHGGGRRCEYDSCTKGAVGKTSLCLGHSGGRRCEHNGCTTAARGGVQPYCKAHGGGRRCKHDVCTKAAEGKQFCVAHGGGRRCKQEVMTIIVTVMVVPVN
jgi:hypothetical protein